MQFFGVELHHFFEESLLVLRRDAGAGVRDDDAQLPLRHLFLGIFAGAQTYEGHESPLGLDTARGGLDIGYEECLHSHAAALGGDTQSGCYGRERKERVNERERENERKGERER